MRRPSLESSKFLVVKAGIPEPFVRFFYQLDISRTDRISVPILFFAALRLIRVSQAVKVTRTVIFIFNESLGIRAPKGLDSIDDMSRQPPALAVNCRLL